MDDFVSKKVYHDAERRYMELTDVLYRIIANYRQSDEDARMEYLIEEAERLVRWGGKTLRPEVRRFAEAMETRLRANDHKPGWKNDSVESLLNRVDDEMLELHMAIATATDKSVILLEAADTANFLMMVVDVCGQLTGMTWIT